MQRLKILIVSFRFPWPHTRGDTLTVYRMLEFLGRSHDVDLLCGQKPATPDAERQIRALVRQLHYVPFGRWAAFGRVLRAVPSRHPLQAAWCCSSKLIEKAAELAGMSDYDVCIAYYLRVAEAIRQFDGTQRIVAFQLSLAVQWSRAAEHQKNPLLRALYRNEAERLAIYERELHQSFDRCLVISKHDLEKIGDWAPDRVHFNPHGVDLERFKPDPAVERAPGSILMTGRLAFGPNEDAACYFATEVFPLIVKEMPSARLTFVGEDPSRRLRALAENSSINVVANVPSMVEYLCRHQVGIAPLRIGAGLQNKVLEGLSCGLPMVVSSIANEGIGATDGTELLVADDTRDYADKVIRLLRDSDLRDDLGRAGRRFIEKSWSWDYHFHRLEDFLKSTVQEKSSAAPV